MFTNRAKSSKKSSATNHESPVAVDYSRHSPINYCRHSPTQFSSAPLTSVTEAPYKIDKIKCYEHLIKEQHLLIEQENERRVYVETMQADAAEVLGAQHIIMSQKMKLVIQLQDNLLQLERQYMERQQVLDECAKKSVNTGESISSQVRKNDNILNQIKSTIKKAQQHVADGVNVQESALKASNDLECRDIKIARDEVKAQHLIETNLAKQLSLEDSAIKSTLDISLAEYTQTKNLLTDANLKLQQLKKSTETKQSMIDSPCKSAVAESLDEVACIDTQTQTPDSSVLSNNRFFTLSIKHDNINLGIANNI